MKYQEIQLSVGTAHVIANIRYKEEPLTISSGSHDTVQILKIESDEFLTPIVMVAVVERLSAISHEDYQMDHDDLIDESEEQ